MKDTHDEGPWVLELGGGRFSISMWDVLEEQQLLSSQEELAIYSAYGGKVVCLVRGESWQPMISNARLIASAPLLLKTLREARRNLTFPTEESKLAALEQIDAVIASVIGEE